MKRKGDHSPFSIFSSGTHGCIHIAALKSHTYAQGSAAAQQVEKNYSELILAFRTAIRLQLCAKNKYIFSDSRKALQKLDLESRKNFIMLEKEIRIVESVKKVNSWNIDVPF